MNIEFIDPVLPSRRAWIAVAALGALAAVLFAAGRIMEARIAVLESDARARAVASALVQATPRPEPPPYAEDLKRALDRAALPEAAALKELETVAVIGIQLSSIDIDMATHTATVELQADDDRVLGEYLDQLNAGMTTPLWHIDRLSAVQAVARPQSAPAGLSFAQSVTLKRRF